MAVTVEELRAVMRMEMKPFMRDLQQMNGVSAKAAKQVEQTWRAANRRLDGIGKNMARSLIAPMAGIGAALGARELIRLTDTWTDLNSRVALAAGGMEQGAEVMQRLGEVARRTYSSLEQTAEGYLLNATAMRELGYSTSQTLDYTESVNNALVISGAKGQRAEAVMNALSKAMAGGKLSGDNLNTVIEQGGRLAEALAEGLGVGVNQLRALGSQGKITGRDIVRSLSTQMERLRREAEEMPATISDGVQLLQNALLEYVGNADQATGISAKISEALVIMADNFDKTADVALQLAGVIAGALVGRSLLKMISTLGLAGSALVNFTRALSAARTMAGLATAFGGLGAAAGPVGLLIGGAVVSSLIAYSSATADATRATRTYEEALAAVKKTAEETAAAVDEQTRIISEKARNELVAAIAVATSEVERLSGEMQTELHNAIVLFENLSDMNLVTPEQLQQLRDMKEEFESGKKTAGQVEEALHSLANSNPRFQNIAEGVKGITAALLDAVAAAALLAAQMHAADSAEQGGANFDRGGRVRARQALQARKEESRLWEAEQTRRAQLGKDQLALENEIARVKKQAADDGIRVTDDQIRRIAEANLAGNASRGAEGKKPKEDRDAKAYERLKERINENVDAMRAEYAALSGLNPLIDDYGYALEKARATHELLTAAKKAGLEVTPKLEAEIEALADAYAKATVEAAKLAEEQDRAREAAEAWEESVEHMFKEAGDALVSVIDGSEKAADAVKKLAIQFALAAAQAALLGSGPLAGIVPSIFGLKDGTPPLRLANGTPPHQGPGRVSGPGGPRGDKVPAWLSDKEFVVRADMAQKHRGLLDAINANQIPTYANGTPPLALAPRMPSLAGMRSGGRGPSSATFNMSVSVSGTGDKELEARLQKATEIQMNEALRVYDREVLPVRVNQVANDPYARG